MPPKRKVIKTEPKERNIMNIARDIKLKKIVDLIDEKKLDKKKTLSRAEINAMRDKEHKRVKKQLGIGAGRPIKARTQMKSKVAGGVNWEEIFNLKNLKL